MRFHLKALIGRPLKAQRAKLTVPKSASGISSPVEASVGASAMTSAEYLRAAAQDSAIVNLAPVVSLAIVKVKCPAPWLFTVPVITSPGLTARL